MQSWFRSFRLRSFVQRVAAAVLAVLACASNWAAAQSLGVTELPPRGGDGPVTVFYRAAALEQPLLPGARRIRLAVARDAAPQPGNGRLVMVSHGSGGSPWVHADLARLLVGAGYTVAVPRHRGDNYLDDSEPGPASWERRPGELSRAIDAVAADARFAALLRFDRVGMYGMSAGGHTALTLAGGRWSPALYALHCRQHVAEDFNACAGLLTGLDGGWLDAPKQWLVRHAISGYFGRDETLRGHTDARIAAIVAAVPYAADFDFSTLARPAVPLALATAAGDTWLHPRFHSSRVLQACTGCDHWEAPPAAGHGAYLSPLPAGLGGLAGRLLNDPPGFDRAAMSAIDLRCLAFFDRHLHQD
jgi:predicted dienelactone hydrolase